MTRSALARECLVLISVPGRLDRHAGRAVPGATTTLLPLQGEGWDGGGFRREVQGGKLWFPLCRSPGHPGGAGGRLGWGWVPKGGPRRETLVSLFVVHRATPGGAGGRLGWGWVTDVLNPSPRPFRYVLRPVRGCARVRTLGRYAAACVHGRGAAAGEQPGNASSTRSPIETSGADNGPRTAIDPRRVKSPGFFGSGLSTRSIR